MEHSKITASALSLQPMACFLLSFSLQPMAYRKILFEYALFYDLPMFTEFLSRHEFVKAKQICPFQDGKLTFNTHLYMRQRKNFLLNYTD